MTNFRLDDSVQRPEPSHEVLLKNFFINGTLLTFVCLLMTALMFTGCQGKKKKKQHFSTVETYTGSGDASAPNAARPTVEAGPLRSANREIFLDAQTTNGVSWQWEQLAGPGTLVIQSAETEDTAVAADRDGFYWLRLTVTAKDGTTAFDDVQLLWDTVAPCPTLAKDIKTFKPIDINGLVGTDASEMTWSQISGPGTLVFGSPKAVITSIAADLDGTYGVRLTAADAVGNVCSADMTFIWETTVPTVAIGQDIFTNKEVAIDAASLDGATFAWSKVSGPGDIIFSRPDQEDTSVKATVDGSYVLSLTITTESGVTASDEITFVWDTVAPALSLGQDFTSKYRASIDAATVDAVTFEWKKLSGPGKVIFSASGSEDTALVSDQAGDYEIGLIIKDQAGNETVDSIIIHFEYDVRVFAKEVSSGGSHTCAVLDDATVACWGYNYAQELGYGDANRFGEGTDRYMPPSFPINLGLGRTARAVAVNYSHSCAILDDNSVKCWGQNASGQLGYGDSIRRGTPGATAIDLGINRTAVSLAAGFSHTCAILDNGSVKCWGANSGGQLGYGDFQNRLAPPATAINLGSGRTALSMSLGAYHTCALLDDSTVKCWGNNANGQLGLGDKIGRSLPDAKPVDIGNVAKIVQIAAGAYHTCALLESGALTCWGRNRQGQLGYGDLVERLAPGDGFVNVGPRDVASVTGGLAHTCVLMEDSTVQCWGANEEGQLGYGDVTNRLAPPQTAIPFGDGVLVKAVSAGRLHNCALLEDSTLKCWGSNSYGQLGGGKIIDGSTPPPSVIDYGD